LAQIKSTTFVGVPVQDGEPDALTFGRTLEAAIGDTVLARGVVSGLSSPPSGSIHNHIGDDGSTYQRGALLGVPLVNCIWPQSGAAGPSYYHLTGDEIHLFTVPVYMPRGETGFTVVLGTQAETLQHRVKVFDEEMEPVAERTMERRLDDPGYLTAVFGDGSLSDGTIYILAIWVKADPGGPGVDDLDLLGVHATSLFVGWTRKARGALLASPVSAGAQFPLSTQTTSGATIPTLPTLDDALLADGRAIPSYALVSLNAYQNALEEQLTGAPAAGNAALTLEPTGGDGAVNPERSAFHDHSLTLGHLTQHYVDFPLWADVFGGTLSSGLPAGFNDDFGDAWEPVYPIDGDPTVGATLDTIGIVVEAPIYIPQFCDAGTTDSSDRVECVLVFAVDTAGGNPIIDVDITDAGGTVIGASSDTVQSVTGNANICVAIVTDIEFYPDALNILRVRWKASFGAAVTDKYRLLGACAYHKGNG